MQIVYNRFDSIGTTIASIDTQGVVKVWKNEPRITTLATVMFQSPIQCLEWCNKPDNMVRSKKINKI